ncbi:hypothetical protein HID58_047647, partial [Brassica napus]
SADLAISPPTMDSIPLWAHRRAQPCGWFDRTPVEANEFTIRMISLDVAHLKVRAYCTKPLPPLVELLRDDGSIIPIS